MMCTALLYSCVCIWLSNGALSKSVYVCIYIVEFRFTIIFLYKQINKVFITNLKFSRVFE